MTIEVLEKEREWQKEIDKALKKYNESLTGKMKKFEEAQKKSNID